MLSSLIEGRILGVQNQQEMLHFGMSVPTYLVKTLDTDMFMENLINAHKVSGNENDTYALNQMVCRI